MGPCLEEENSQHRNSCLNVKKNKSRGFSLKNSYYSSCIKSAPKFLHKFYLVPQKSISEAFAPIVCHGRKKQVQRLGTYEHMLQLIYTPQRSLKDEVSEKGAEFMI